jgi:predicted nucleotidyltransferase
VFIAVKDATMMRDVFVSTNLQRALSLLAEHPDQSYFVKEISRLADISYGGASEALAHLHSLGLITREQRGKLVLYTANTRHPLIRHYKILLTLAELTPLLDELKPLASEVILFGSCAEGANTAESDIDLYIMTDDPDAVHDVIWRNPLAEKLRSVISTPIESIETRQQDPIFYEQVMRGIVLWRRSPPDES